MTIKSNDSGEDFKKIQKKATIVEDNTALDELFKKKKRKPLPF